MADDGDVLSRFAITVPPKADYGRLRKIPFFNVFKEDEDLATVAKGGVWLGCPKGTTIMRDGEMEFDFFVVVKGCIEVLKDGRVIGEACEGELLGEMGALLHEYRSADAVVKEDCILFRLHVTSLNNLPLQVVFPLMVFIYRITAKRLKRAGEKLSHM